jgi:hypothetical protein
MAQASFLCGLLDEANSCLDMIISNEHDIELKIDSYIFEAEISFLGRKALPQAFEEFKHVLGILGEVIPDKDECVRNASLQVAKSTYEMKDSELSHYIPTDEQCIVATMRAYSQLVSVVYLFSPDIYPYIVSRWGNTPGQKSFVPLYF